MRFVLGALALAGMTAGVSAQAPKPVEAPRPHAGAQREAPGDLGMAIMSAKVRSDGVLSEGAGAISATRFSLGDYRVKFGRNVQSCTPIVTSNSILELTFTASTNNSDVIISIYFSGGGEFYDADFNLIVYCHK